MLSVEDEDGEDDASIAETSGDNGRKLDGKSGKEIERYRKRIRSR